MGQQCLNLFHIESNTNIPVTLQTYGCGRTFSNICSISEVAENPGNESLQGCLIITEQVLSLLIGVSRNKNGLCFEKLIFILGNCFVFW